MLKTRITRSLATVASAAALSLALGAVQAPNASAEDPLCIATEDIAFYREVQLIHHEYTASNGTPIRVHQTGGRIWYGHAEGHSDDFFVAIHSDGRPRTTCG